MAQLGAHPFLTGNYAPLGIETTISGLAVEGRLPAGLEGQFVRMGPNPIGTPATPYDWAAADGMVHAVDICGGRASYRNRWILTCRVATRLGVEKLRDHDVAHASWNARLVRLDGRTWCPSATDVPYELAPDLDTIGVGDEATRRLVAAADPCASDGGRNHLAHPVNEYVDDLGRLVRVVPGPTGLVRQHVDVVTRHVSSEQLDDTPLALGRMNDSFRGRRHRHLYTIRLGLALPFDGTDLHRYDLDPLDRVTHHFGAGSHPGEFVFVADRDRIDREAGGWLVGFVHHDDTAHATLDVIDAELVAEAPVARIHIPQRIPYGLHATWLPFT